MKPASLLENHSVLLVERRHRLIFSGTDCYREDFDPPKCIFFNNDLKTKLSKLTSIMCNFPPCVVLTAKQNSVDTSGFPSILNIANDAAWPSMGCETLRSTEYSCMAPTTRDC